MAWLTFFQLLQLDTEEFENWLYRIDACEGGIDRFRGLSAVQAFFCLSPNADDWDLIRWIERRVNSIHLKAIVDRVNVDHAHLRSKRIAYSEVLSILDPDDNPYLTMLLWQYYEVAEEEVIGIYRAALIELRDWVFSSGTYQRPRFAWEDWTAVQELHARLDEGEQYPNPYEPESIADHAPMYDDECGLNPYRESGASGFTDVEYDQYVNQQERDHLQSVNYGDDENTDPYAGMMFFEPVYDTNRLRCTRCGVLLDNVFEAFEHNCNDNGAAPEPVIIPS